MANITVVGPGAIGGLVAARLSQNPANTVAVAARSAFAELQLDTAGETLRPGVRILTNPQDAVTADWILVATKAYDSEAAAEWFASSLGDDTAVAVLQNGIDHVDRFAAWLPRDRILPVVVDCPSERAAPGHIRQRGPASLTVPSGGLGSGFARLFDGTGIDCRIVDDFSSAAWWKLCLNAAGVINALTLQPARIAHNSTAARLMRNIVLEAAAVGRAAGAQLPADIADEIVEIYRGHPPDSINSLHADRLAGRPMEIELRNGVIVELGKRVGIPTPCNEMAVSLMMIARTSRLAETAN